MDNRCKPCRYRVRQTRGGYSVLAWSCGHEEVCFVCGQILRFTLPPKECPQYDGKGAK